MTDAVWIMLGVVMALGAGLAAGTMLVAIRAGLAHQKLAKEVEAKEQAAKRWPGGYYFRANDQVYQQHPEGLRQLLVPLGWNQACDLNASNLDARVALRDGCRLFSSGEYSIREPIRIPQGELWQGQNTRLLINVNSLPDSVFPCDVEMLVQHMFGFGNESRIKGFGLCFTSVPSQAAYRKALEEGRGLN